MTRLMLWFIGFSILLVCLSVPIYPILGLILYFVAAACMIPACISFKDTPKEMNWKDAS